MMAVKKLKYSSKFWCLNVIETQTDKMWRDLRAIYRNAPVSSENYVRMYFVIRFNVLIKTLRVKNLFEYSFERFNLNINLLIEEHALMFSNCFSQNEFMKCLR